MPCPSWWKYKLVVLNISSQRFGAAFGFRNFTLIYMFHIAFSSPSASQHPPSCFLLFHNIVHCGACDEPLASSPMCVGWGPLCQKKSNVCCSSAPCLCAASFSQVTFYHEPFYTAIVLSLRITIRFLCITSSKFRPPPPPTLKLDALDILHLFTSMLYMTWQDSPVSPLAQSLVLERRVYVHPFLPQCHPTHIIHK